MVTQLSKGIYSLDTVTSCVHRMWDGGLQYDSVDAVLKELKAQVTDAVIYICVDLIIFYVYNFLFSYCYLFYLFHYKKDRTRERIISAGDR